MPKNTEQGEAKLIIRLKDGNITVFHADGTPVMPETAVKPGTWKKMLGEIRRTINEGAIQTSLF